MKSMTKNNTRSWLYMVLTVYAPILIAGAYVATMVFCSHQRNNAQLTKLWETLYPAFQWIGWILMPVLTNIAFGPSLLAFTVCKKKSRFLILIANVIVIGMTAVIYGDNINERFEPGVWPVWTEYLPFLAIPLLLVWAKFGKAAEATGNARAGAKMVLAHICAIAAMFAWINYKSPERQVAEQLLNRMTIKWTHDGKTEYFKTYGRDISKGFLFFFSGSGVKYEGAPPPRSTEGYSYATWVKNSEGAYYDMTYTNRGVGFWFNNYGEKMHWEYISYQQLLKSEEFELIKSRGFWPKLSTDVYLK